jgi:hypothetical protein
MIKLIYTTTDIWEVDTELQQFIIGLDRVIITNKSNPDINTIIFTDNIIAIETREDSIDELETISIGTSD